MGAGDAVAEVSVADAAEVGADAFDAAGPGGGAADEAVEPEAAGGAVVGAGAASYAMSYTYHQCYL